MKKYHKIQTVFKRDPKNLRHLLIGQYSMPEFAYLANCEWTWTEKVDGTNTRVIYPVPGKVEFGGKTDTAQIPATLVKRLNEKFNTDVHEWPDHDAPITLYGEGFGPRIQKGGGNYGTEQDFVLFDVLVGEWWLKREAVEDVAATLGILCVPIVGRGTLAEMIAYVQSKPDSRWGDFTAEGVVARPTVELFARNGDRIITKLKVRDFA